MSSKVLCAKNSQDVTAMVIAERSKYLENPDFKLKMKKNPDLLIEMFSGKLFSKP